MKTCKKCNEPKPIESFTVDIRYTDGRYPWCAECRRAWRQGRKERQRELRREWYARDIEHGRQYGRDYYHQHKDKIAPKRRKYDRERWHSDPAYRAKKNQWKYDQLKSNPEFREKRREWARISSHRRRERDRAVVNSLTRLEWHAILREQNHRCAACNRKFGVLLKPTMDHIVPQSRGGALTKDNVQALCVSCNSRKHAKTVDYRPLKQASFLDGDD